MAINLTDDCLRLIKYLSFKMDMLREQEEYPIHLNVEQTQHNYNELHKLQKEKVEQLVEVMPKIPVMKSKAPPKVMFKKDGSYSSNAFKWFDFLEAQGLPRDTSTEVNYVSGWNEANPNSVAQVKNWLFSLGWKPTTFKFTRDSEGNEKRIEQVRKDGLLCESVTKLIEVEPNIALLEGLTIINHRLGILKSFLNSHKGGKLVAGAGGFANTLRMQHRAPICNLPSVDTTHGDKIRSVLIPPRGKIFCGADVSSLEDSLKQHFIYPHDPEYVDSMNQVGFDPHLSLAVKAGKITQEDYEHYVAVEQGVKEKDSQYFSIKKIRHPMKTVNYSCQYSVGAKTLSRNSGLSLDEAKNFIEVYWTKNWAVKKVASEQYIKTLPDGTLWLKNPINGFYYLLRYEKDTFSTLVQGSGDYVFCLWTMLCRSYGLKISLNYHDEWLASIDPKDKEKTLSLAQKAMAKVNNILKLNKEIGMDAKFGYSYAEVH